MVLKFFLCILPHVSYHMTESLARLFPVFETSQIFQRVELTWTSYLQTPIPHWFPEDLLSPSPWSRMAQVLAFHWKAERTPPWVTGLSPSRKCSVVSGRTLCLKWIWNSRVLTVRWGFWIWNWVWRELMIGCFLLVDRVFKFEILFMLLWAEEFIIFPCAGSVFSNVQYINNVTLRRWCRRQGWNTQGRRRVSQRQHGWCHQHGPHWGMEFLEEAPRRHGLSCAKAEGRRTTAEEWRVTPNIVVLL